LEKISREMKEKEDVIKKRQKKSEDYTFENKSEDSDSKKKKKKEFKKIFPVTVAYN